jgi:hypothetical protein
MSFLSNYEINKINKQREIEKEELIKENENDRRKIEQRNNKIAYAVDYLETCIQHFIVDAKAISLEPDAYFIKKKFLGINKEKIPLY